jgi:hypothetical protein
MTNWLPNRQYLIRELLPRAVLLTILFRCFLTVITFGMLTFNGELISAIVFGVAFTALFSFFGAYFFRFQPIAKFMARHENSKWLMPANLIFAIAMPAGALFLTSLIVPTTLVMNGWIGALLGTVILNVACMLTHDAMVFKLFAKLCKATR